MSNRNRPKKKINGARPKLAVIDEAEEIKAGVNQVMDELTDEPIELSADDPAIQAYMERYKAIFTVVKDALVQTVVVLGTGVNVDEISRIAQDATEKLMVL